MKRCLGMGLVALCLAPALAHADYTRCSPNHRWSTVTDLDGGQTIRSSEFDVQEHDRVFVRGRGAPAANYAIVYQLEQKVGTSWIIRLRKIPGSPDAELQRLVRAGETGPYRLTVFNSTTKRGGVSVDLVVVWHEEPSCQDAFDKNPSATTEKVPMDGCFGASGPNCDGMPHNDLFPDDPQPPATDSYGRRLLRSNPGAQKHDTCCNVQNWFWSKTAPQGCAGEDSRAWDNSVPETDSYECSAEYAAAGNDVQNSNGGWKWFNAATIYLTGVYMASRASSGQRDFIVPGTDTVKFSAANLAPSDVDGGWCAGGTAWAYYCCTTFGCGSVRYSSTQPGFNTCSWGQALKVAPYKRCL